MRGRPRSGFALLLVLFVVSAVGVIAAEAHLAARAERQLALNARAATRARWAARGGLALALDRLHRAAGVAADPRDALPAVGDTLLLLAPAGATAAAESVRIVVLDARARVQINRAGADELLRLGVAAGLAHPAAARLADAILDWRDPDDLHRAQGAERAAYRAVDAAWAPKNGAFDAVEELAGVYGVTPVVYARLAPLLTVAGDGRVNLNSAPAPVLATLPGIDAVAAAAIVARRARTPYRNVYELAPTLPEPARSAVRDHLGVFVARAAFAPRDVEVWVAARGAGAPVGAELRAVVALTGGTGVRLLNVVER